MKNKHLAVILIVIIIALIPAAVFAAGTGVFFDDDITIVNSFDELKESLQNPNVHSIRVNRNIKDDNKNTEFSGIYIPEIDISVEGEKTLDLNGHKIVYSSYRDYNNYLTDTDFSGSETYFIDVPENSSLSVIDSKGNGQIEYRGFILNSSNYIYKNSIVRNLFCVEGILNVYGGTFRSGNSKKQLISAALVDSEGILSKPTISFVNQAVFGSCVSLFDHGKFNCYGGYFYSNGFENEWKESCIYIGADANAEIFDGSFTSDFGSTVFDYSKISSLTIHIGSFENKKIFKLRTPDIINSDKIIHTFSESCSDGINFSDSILKDASAVICVPDEESIKNSDQIYDLEIRPASGTCIVSNSSFSESAVVYNGENSKYIILDGYEGLIGQDIHFEYILQQYDNNGNWNTVVPWSSIEDCTDGKIYIADLFSEWIEKTKYRVSIRILESFNGYNNSFSTVRQSNYLTILSGYDVILTKGECTHSWEELSDTATCLSDGEKIFSCRFCGQVKTEISPKNNNHIASPVFEKNTNNCYKKCIICGQLIENHKHSYIQSTSSSDYLTQTKYKRCIYCGDIKKDVLINNSLINNNSSCEHKEQLSEDELNDYECFVLCSYANSDCKNHGHISCRICKLCGEIFSLDGKSISVDEVFTVPLSSHIYSNNCDSTCNSCGYTRKVSHYYLSNKLYSNVCHYSKCSICGYCDNVHQHDFVYSVEKQSSCELEGCAGLSCICGFKIDITLPPKGHQLMHIIEESASCSNPESADYFRCIDCNKIFADSNADNPIKLSEIITGEYNSDVHIGGQLMADSKYHWEKCSCGENINKQKHRFVDKICVDCGYKKDSENLR